MHKLFLISPYFVFISCPYENVFFFYNPFNADNAYLDLSQQMQMFVHFPHVFSILELILHFKYFNVDNILIMSTGTTIKFYAN
jgi:hypothetical protein